MRATTAFDDTDRWMSKYVVVVNTEDVCRQVGRDLRSVGRLQTCVDGQLAFCLLHNPFVAEADLAGFSVEDIAACRFLEGSVTLRGYFVEIDPEY